MSLMIVPQKYVSAAFGFDLPWKPDTSGPPRHPKTSDLAQILPGAERIFFCGAEL
jgi:hypothetical protein